jgi:hypothetical protein
MVRRVDLTAAALRVCWIGLFLISLTSACIAQTVTLTPTCGKPGDTVCIGGSGWAEPNPLCRYIFTMDGISIAPDQQDGLYGPPSTNGIVPSLPDGSHTVLVQLVLDDSSNTLIQQQTAPFTVSGANATPGSATTSPTGSASITLAYNPSKPSCDSSCKQVVWVQVVQRFARKQGTADAQAVVTTATDWPTLPDSALKAIDETPDANRARVDRIWGRTFPYYGVDNSGIPNAGGGNAAGTITVGGTGATPISASMYDAPYTAAPFPTTLNGQSVTIDKAILKFEAAPFCADGDQVGTFLGQVVTWESDQLVNQSATVTNASVQSGQPSSTFMAALNRWVSGNPPGTGTNRAAFNLPQPKVVQCLY